jgi:integrase/recombinase XerC
MTDVPGTALHDYERYLQEQEDLSATTRRGYLGDVRQFVKWCEQEWNTGSSIPTPFDPAQVSTPMLTKYRDHLQNTLNLKPASVNRYLVSLKRYFAWATDETKCIQRDPAHPVRLIKRNDSTPRQLSDTEENRLMTQVLQHGSLRDRVLITLLLHTGLRAGEACKLQRKHVTHTGRTERLRIYGKGNRYREIPLNATAREAIRELLITLPEDENTWLFTGEHRSKPITERTLGRIIKHYANGANIPDLSPHDLRHRFAYRLMETDRVPLHRVAELMGHDSLDTTRLYIKGTAADLQRAVDAIAWE